MKAVIVTAYGAPDVLKFQEVEKPTPEDHEIRVRVRAVSVGYGDLTARNFAHISPREFNMLFLLWVLARLSFGLRTPKKQILGSEFAGDVEAVGQAVTRFKVGDPVFGYRGPDLGANAEYLCVPEDGLVALKPDNMTYAEAAAVPYGALTALTLLRKVNIQPGHKVLILGASGAIGSAAVQLAKMSGAEVTGVCSTPRLAYVRALGADKVIDYTQEDFTRNGETYDLIFDILGKGSFTRSKGSLKPNGRYLFASFKLKQLVQMLWTGWVGDKKVICALSTEKPADLEQIREMMAVGQIKAIIDRCFPLEQAAEAHRYVEGGHKQGSVILTPVAVAESERSVRTHAALA